MIYFVGITAIAVCVIYSGYIKYKSYMYYKNAKDESDD